MMLTKVSFLIAILSASTSSSVSGSGVRSSVALRGEEETTPLSKLHRNLGKKNQEKKKKKKKKKKKDEEENELCNNALTLEVKVDFGQSLDDVGLLDISLIFMAPFIFFMQAGFAMLEAGSVRQKNVKNIMLKNILDACGGALGFWSVGYAFAYGSSDDNDTMSMNGALSGLVGITAGSPIVAPMDALETWLLFLKSQAGTVAEREDDFPPHSIALQVLGTFILWVGWYGFNPGSTLGIVGDAGVRAVGEQEFDQPLNIDPNVGGFGEEESGADAVDAIPVHFFKGAPLLIGWLEKYNGGALFDLGMIDFAGSGVVHMTGGITALIAAKILGPRLGGKDVEQMSPLGATAATIVAGAIRGIEVEETEAGDVLVGYTLDVCKSDGSDFEEEEVGELETTIGEELQKFILELAEGMGLTGFVYPVVVNSSNPFE